MQKSLSKVSTFLFWLKGYLCLLAGAMTFMTGVRLLWFFTYRKGDELSLFWGDFLNSLWLGIRFDLSAFCHLSSVSFLIWMAWIFLGPKHWRDHVLNLQRRIWIFLILFLVFILAADFAFYGYFQDHFNALVFGLFQDDTSAILRTVWKNYPVITIISSIATLIWVLNHWFLKLWRSPHPVGPATGMKQHGLAILAFLAVILGARGSLGLFPLEIMHTAISPNAFLNTLSFNGVHALAHAIKLYDQQRQSWNENLIQLGYRDNPKQALMDFSKILNISEVTNHEFPIERLTSKKMSPLKQPPHVVIVLMESWGSDWMQKDTPEFNLLGAFARHKSEDLFTPHLMPSSVATIGSLGSLVVDMPHRFYSPFLTESSYLGVKFSTAPAAMFKQQGYQTHFIYGGNLGWRSIDKFLPRQGFDRLHGEAEIKKRILNYQDEEVSHDWGVYDEFVFKYAKDLLSRASTPQFLFILTTSNHPPYTLPKHFSALPLEFKPEINQTLIGDINLDHERLKVYQYANHQLGLFLDDLKKEPLSKKVIVAATGDHSFYIRPYENLEFFEKWSVPLYLYLPSNYRMGTSQKLTMGNHIDIFPTIYNLVFSEMPYYSLGQDLLSPYYKPWAYHGPSWSSFNEKYGIIISPSGEIVTSLCRKNDGKLEACPLETTHEKLRKHLVSMMGSADFIFEKQRHRNARKTAGK